MDDKFQQQIAFHLTGSSEGSNLVPMTASHRPALFARYTDLTSLRYDFPLVLNSEDAPDRAVLSLSRLIDDVISQLAGDSDRDRIARHAYRIEHEIRRELASQGNADFAALWNTAATRITDEGIEDSAKELWSRFLAAGDLVEVDSQLPVRTFRHLWKVVQERKGRAFSGNAERLLFKLHSILEAENQNSEIGRSPERLKAGVGATFAGTFDFDAMSRILGESKPVVRLSDKRRERIQGLISVFERQRFYPVGTDAPAAYSFTFTRCEDALKAYRQRHDEAVELLKALAIAELEAKGEYREVIHDRIFEGFGSAGVNSVQIGKLPDYLVTINTSSLDAEEAARIIELLSAGLPVKILVQSDDILEPSSVIEEHIGLAARSRQLTSTAMGLTDVFVLQCAASYLYSLRESAIRGLMFNGPGLFSIFSGSNTHTSRVPAYLVSAAAMESRAFPTFVYDPSAGQDWSTRITLEGNPIADSDWPSYTFDYEDESVQARSETLAFTFADFLAMDERFADHFAVVPKTEWSDSMVPIADELSSEMEDLPTKIPTVMLIDDEFRLSRAIVDARVQRATRRCLSMWHSLQELGGINNSYVKRLVSQDYRPAIEATQLQEPQAAAASEGVEIIVEPGTPSEPNEPYIETARCTTCNECTQINNKMFAYNADKQAYIAHVDAGTFRQLVEAAESCQVSIIHPGKPRNPNEPGLDELINRASVFS